MKNLQIGRVIAVELGEIAGADRFSVHPIVQTLAISTPSRLVLIDNDIVTNSVDWSQERRESRVVSLNFRTDGNQIVAILADGRALIVEEEDVMEVEIAEIGNEAVTAAEWTPDEQILAIADNFMLYLADSSLVPFAERPLNFSETDPKRGPVNVGWGSETTQFRGSAGKLKPGEKIEKQREDVEQHSTTTSVHWRWDAEIVAVSFFSEDVRKMTIFDKNGEILNSMNIRNLYLSNCFAHKPNANLICSAILEPDSDDRLVFFERNGETRNSYVVKWPRQTGKRIIENIEWNSTGTILAMQTAQDGQASLELWQMSNYEFTRKYTWQPNEPFDFQWSTVDSQQLHVLLKSSGQFLSIHVSPLSSLSDVVGQNVVVATDELRIYSLCRRVVPPPMCDHAVVCPEDVVVFTTSSHRIHVVLKDRKIISYSQDTNNYKFDSDRLSIDAILPPETGLICGFVYDEPNESYIIWSVNHTKHTVRRVGIANQILFEHPNIGWIGVNSTTKNVEIATNDGIFIDLASGETLFEIDSFESVEVHFVQNHHVILADNTRLYIDSNRVSLDAVSILTRNSDILLIDFDNKLRFIDVVSTKAAEDVRDVEAGCELVACDASSANVILQAARGNLETIQPRRYVMSHTRHLLDKRDYVTAFKWMKKHRVDMSFAIEHTGSGLEHDIDVWMDGVRESQLGEQLVVSCTEKFEEQGNALCGAIHRYFERMEDVERKTTMFPVMLTALLRTRPARVNDALKEIQEHVEKIESRKDVFTRHSLHHISFFVPAADLFNCALSTYDLKLAQQVAEASNYDPKEYLPVLNQLNRVVCPLERRYRINVVRQAWRDALEALFELDERLEDVDEWWNDAVDIIRRESMHQTALTLIAPTAKRYRACCELYGNELERTVHWKQAALFYELAGCREKTLKCWEMARDVDGLLAAARRLNIDNSLLKVHAIKMSTALKDGRQLKELAKALKLAGAQRSRIVQTLCDALEWTMASREVDDEDTRRLLRTSAIARHEQMIGEIRSRGETFDAHRRRLMTVRENKMTRVARFAAGDVDDLRDDVSVVSSLSSRSGSSRTSMASSVRRRKQIEKKKASLKEGGEYEDSALLTALAEQYRWMEMVGNELCQLVPVLMSVGHFGESIELAKSYEEFVARLQKSKCGIWPETLSIQHLPGPLHALLDPNQEPSPIPMPPVFRLEPELVAPSSNFAQVFP